MAQQLTDLLLKNLSSNGQPRREIFDGRIAGFGVRVAATGTKTFILVYRHRGRPRRLTLGRYPVLSLADARTKAKEALLAVTRGEDPALTEHAEDDPRFQFENVVTAFVERHCAIRNKPSTARETERLLRKHFVAAWGKRDIRDIRQSHINAVLDELVTTGRPSEANHALGVVKTLFAWCVDRTMLAVNPCQAVKKPARHGARARVLTDDELRRVWQAMNDEGHPFGTMGKLLILTGQRRGEVTQMQWSQLDLKEAVWTIPPELSKNGREHLLPLSPQAVALIRGVTKTESDFVFPARGNRDNVISGFTRAKRRFDETSKVSEWTLHDLRRTAATGMARRGVPPHVVERILNHVSGTFAGVAGVYNRFQYLPEMRAALETWERHVLALAAEGENLTEASADA